jgi:ribonuclease P protein component
VKRLSFGKSERIKDKKHFEKIYESGKVFFSSDKKVKAVYLFIDDSDVNYPMVAVAVSKKAGNAFWRNRVKRLLREAYRLNKLPISAFCVEERKQLYIILSPFRVNQKENKTIKLFELLPGVQEILGTLLKSDEK